MKNIDIKAGLVLLTVQIICTLQIFAQTVNNDKRIELRIDPSNSTGTAVSSVFEEVKFIPLETTSKSTFGKITQLEIADNHFIIFDSDTKAIYVFNEEGRFRSKINLATIAAHNDGKTTNNFYGFKIKTDNNSILIELKLGQKMSYFNLDGMFIKDRKYEIPLDEKSYSIPDTNLKIKSNKWVKSGADSSLFEIAIYSNENKLLNKYFPYKQIKNNELIGSGKNLFYSGRSGEVFYTRYYDYNIYKLDQHSASLAYQIILPENVSLPPKFHLEEKIRGKRMEYLVQNYNIYFGVFNTYKFGNNLFFNLNSMGAQKRAFLYKLDQNELIAVGDIEPDKLSQFLPISDDGFLFEYANSGFNLYKDGYLYNSYSSLAMFAFKQQSTNKKVIYSEALKKYFKTQDKKSNPIIVKLKPKQT